MKTALDGCVHDLAWCWDCRRVLVAIAPAEVIACNQNPARESRALR